MQRLWWAGGLSGPEGRTVRDRSRELVVALVGWRTVRPRWADGPPLYFKKCTREGVSLVGFKVERRTVHPWGADGLPTNLRFIPESLFVSGESDLLTADGPPLGRGQSAG